MAEQTVSYRAVADFSALVREARRAKRELQELRREQDRSGGTINTGDTAVSARGIAGELSKLKRENQELKTETNSLNQELKRLSDQFKTNARSTSEATTATKATTTATKDAVDSSKRHTQALSEEDKQVKSITASFLRAFQGKQRFNEASKSEDVSAFTNALIRQKQAQDEHTVSVERLARVTKESSNSDRARIAAMEEVKRATHEVSAANDEVTRTHQKVIVEQDRHVSSTSRLENAFKRLTGGSGQLGQAFSAIKFPAIVAGISFLANAATAGVAGITALASSLGQLIGLLGAIPALAVGAGSAILAGLLAFKGIGAAVKEGLKAQTDATANQAKLADQREKSAQQVEDAQQSLADAQENAGRRQEQAERSVVEAEKSVARAQKDVTTAQKELTQARIDAVQILKDLQRAAERAGISETRAQFRLEDAQKHLNEVIKRWPRTVTRERIAAELDLREAQLDLADAQDHRVDSEAKSIDAQKKGVDQADNVVAAQQRLADAQQNSADASQRLVDAQKEIVTSQRESARAIERAQRSLTDAIKEQAKVEEEATGANNKFAQSMKDLSPAAQDVVNKIIALKPLFLDLQKASTDAIAPGLLKAIGNVPKLMDTAKLAVRTFGGVLGDFIGKFSELVTSAGFVKDLQTVIKNTEGPFRNLGQAILNFIDGLRPVAIAAQPLVDTLGKLVLHWSELFKAAHDTAEEQEGLRQFFIRVGTLVENLSKLFGNLVGILRGVGRASREMGDTFIGKMVEVTGKWKEFVNSAEGQNKIKAFFEAAKGPIHEFNLLVGDVVKGFASLLTAGTGQNAFGEIVSPVQNIIRLIRTELLPAFLNFAKAIDLAFTPALIKLASDFLNLLSHFAGVTGGLSTFLKTIDVFVRLAVDIVEKVPGASAVLKAFFIGMGIIKGLQLVSHISGLTGVVTGLVGALSGMTAVFGGGKIAAEAAKDLGSISKVMAGIKGVEGVDGILFNVGRSIASLGGAAGAAEGGFALLGTALTVGFAVVAVAAVAAGAFAIVKHLQAVDAQVTTTKEASQELESAISSIDSGDFAEKVRGTIGQLREFESKGQGRDFLFNLGVREIELNGRTPEETVKYLQKIALEAFGPDYILNIKPGDFADVEQKISSLKTATDAAVAGMTSRFNILGQEIESGLGQNIKEQISSITEVLSKEFNTGNLVAFTREWAAFEAQVNSSSLTVKQKADVINFAADEIARGIGKNLGLSIQSIHDLDSEFINLANSPGFARLTGAQQNLVIAYNNARAAGKDEAEALKIAEGAAEAYGAKTGETTGKIEEQKTALEKATAALKNKSDQEKAAASPILAVLKANERVTAAQKRLTEAQEKGDPEAIQEATIALAEANVDLQSAGIAAAGSYDKFDQTLQSWTKTGILSQQSADLLRDSVKGVSASVDHLTGTNNILHWSVDDIEAHKQLDALQGHKDQVAQPVAIPVGANIDPFKADVDKAVEYLRSVRSQTNASIGFIGPQALRAMANAEGGLAEEGRPRLVSAKSFYKEARRFATGSLVPGEGNTDSVPALLTPGEFVVRKEAVQSIGVNNLRKINQFKFSPSAPSPMIQRFEMGGLVQNITPGGKKEEKVGVKIENLVVNNPLPSKVEDTIPDVVRKVNFSVGAS